MKSCFPTSLPTANYLGSMAASERLADIIRQHWAVRGHLVEVRVGQAHTESRSRLHLLRSKMVGGKPRERT